MTRESDETQSLAARLLAEEAAPRPAPTPLATLVDLERAFERRVRRAALVAWAVTLGLLPFLGLALYLEIRGADPSQGPATGAVRVALVLLFGLTGLGLVVALLATLAWLFRARTASLAAIERRLEQLERLLRERAR